MQVKIDPDAAACYHKLKYYIRIFLMAQEDEMSTYYYFYHKLKYYIRIFLYGTRGRSVHLLLLLSQVKILHIFLYGTRGRNVHLLLLLSQVKILHIFLYGTRGRSIHLLLLLSQVCVCVVHFMTNHLCRTPVVAAKQEPLLLLDPAKTSTSHRLQHSSQDQD